MKVVVLIFGIVPATAGQCWPVDGDHIYIHDLARHIEAFKTTEHDAEVGLAPVPGAQRVMRGGQLAAIAARLGITVDAHLEPICFERPMEPLKLEQVRDAIAAMMPPGTHVDVLDFSRQPMPKGELRFGTGETRAATDPQRSVQLLGRLMYAPRQSLPVWARVRVSVCRTVVTAITGISAGSTIQPDQISVAQRDVSPFTEVIASVADAAGRIARKNIRSGQILAAGELDLAPDIRKGETVQVTIISGEARVSLTALAEGSARSGAKVLLANPESHKTFSAIVEGKGRAVVRMGHGT